MWTHLLYRFTTLTILDKDVPTVSLGWLGIGGTWWGFMQEFVHFHVANVHAIDGQGLCFFVGPLIGLRLILTKVIRSGVIMLIDIIIFVITSLIQGMIFKFFEVNKVRVKWWTEVGVINISETLLQIHIVHVQWFRSHVIVLSCLLHIFPNLTHCTIGKVHRQHRLLLVSWRFTFPLFIVAFMSDSSLSALFSAT